MRLSPGERDQKAFIKPQAMTEYNDRLQKEIEAIGVWYAGCTDYYRAPSGRIVTQWPRTMSEHREMLSKLDPDAWETGHPKRS